MMRRVLLVAAALMGCTCSPGPALSERSESKGSGNGSGDPAPPPAAAGDEVQIGDARLPVTVLAADPARSRGWAGLTRLPAEAGLLRVWPRPLYVALGSRGYRAVTDVAFVDADGAVVAVGALRPDDGASDIDGPFLKSPVPVRFALETAPGWLAAHGVREGTRIAIPPALAAGAAEPTWPEMPRGTLRIGDRTIAIEVAYTADDRRRGLMFRNDLPPDTGMLFIYRDARKLGFWMKNCCLPLTVAYLADDGRITGLVDMAPAWHTPAKILPPTYPASESVAYALEMPQGWFAERGITAGQRVTFPPEIADWRRRADP